MKIIIAGLGRTGMLIAEKLSDEAHDVTVIDTDSKKVEKAEKNLKVNGRTGSGISRKLLIDAGAETADVIISLMPALESNIIACMTAKKLGTRYSALRLKDNIFDDDINEIKQQFGIDCIVDQKNATAETIMNQIGLPGYVKAEAFFDSAAIMLKLPVKNGSIFAGKTLMELGKTFDTDIVVGVVKRGNNIFIPNGQFKINENDVISLVTAQNSVEKLIGKLGLLRKPVKNVFIIGGGTTGLLLAKKLAAANKNVTIFESSDERRRYLANELEQSNRISIVNASNIDSELLEEEGIKNADVCVSLTGEDEKNLVMSLFASNCGVASIITKVDMPSYEKLLNNIEMDMTISPTVISSDMLMRYIRNVTVFNEKGNDIHRIYSIAGGEAEAIEFIAYDKFRKTGIPLMSEEFKLKKDILLAAVIRNDKVIIAKGSTTIEKDDKVIVIAKKNHGLNDINDILA